MHNFLRPHLSSLVHATLLDVPKRVSFTQLEKFLSHLAFFFASLSGCSRKIIKRCVVCRETIEPYSITVVYLSDTSHENVMQGKLEEISSDIEKQDMMFQKALDVLTHGLAYQFAQLRMQNQEIMRLLSSPVKIEFPTAADIMAWTSKLKKLNWKFGIENGNKRCESFYEMAASINSRSKLIAGITHVKWN